MASRLQLDESLETHLKLLNAEILPTNDVTLTLFKSLQDQLKKEIDKSNLYIKKTLKKYKLNTDSIENFDREKKAIATIGMKNFQISSLLLDGEVDTFKKREANIIAYSTVGFLHAVRCLFYLYYDQNAQAMRFYTTAIKYLNVGEVLTYEHTMMLGEPTNIHIQGGKQKAANEAFRKEPIYKHLQDVWNQEEWSKKGRGKFTNFANYILHKNPDHSMTYDAIRIHITKYNKSQS